MLPRSLACPALVIATLALVLPATHAHAQQQPQANSDAATRQLATAVALQNREQYDLAAQEWRKFLSA
ncbi:MAG TPA: hypothetical protein VHV77_14805, partial [Pirellulales bacterium]|nr:hypothetical protein [Pirellulales bacterium]